MDPDQSNLFLEQVRQMTSVLRRAKNGETGVRASETGIPELEELAAELNALLARAEAPGIEMEGEAFFQRVFDVLPAEVVIFDSQFRYLYINPVAVKDPAIRKWMIGKTDLEYCALRGIDPKVGRERQQLYRDCIKNGETSAIVQDMVDREGISRNHLRCLSPVFDKEGGLDLLIGYSIEVTALRQKELELQEKNTALRKTTQELDHFVYRASHDLRSPLVSIMGLSELIDMESPKASVAQYLDMIKSRVAKLDLVIREIVNFSKNSQQELRIAALDPLEQIESVLEILSESHKMEGLDIELEVEDGFPWHADAFRVQVLLSNLISNALKFQKSDGSQGSIRISLKVYPSEALLEVEDNGIGIPAAQQAHVFEMFFRATHNGSGAGIGLYLVHEVLEKMNGKIELTSEVGKGTCFRVRIPNFPAPVLQA